MATRASLPKGTRDFLPETLRRREHVVAIIREVYERHGFAPLETPAIENLSTLLGKYGEEGDKLLFKILKRGAKAASGECDLGLRYDLTVPLARVVAMHQAQLPRIFKRYQIQPVWRADRPGRGRFREFYQCDIDVIGGQAPLVEIDLLSAVGEIFERLGFAGVQLRINDRRILTAMVAHAGVPQALETSAIIAIDKLDKIGPDGVKAELERRGIEAEVATRLMGLLDELSGPQVLEEMRRQLTSPPAQEAVDGLEEIAKGLVISGLDASSVLIDPTLARGLDYYTGPIFELVSKDLSGSLAGGGRYDGLIGLFSGQDTPACGVSLGLERILVVMEERGLFPPIERGPALMVANFGSATREAALKLAHEVRKAGIAVDVYPKKDKLGKQFKLANQQGIPFVAVIGPDEAAAGQAKLKEMASGDQEVLDFAAIVARLKG